MTRMMPRTMPKWPLCLPALALCGIHCFTQEYFRCHYGYVNRSQLSLLFYVIMSHDSDDSTVCVCVCVRGHDAGTPYGCVCVCVSAWSRRRNTLRL